MGRKPVANKKKPTDYPQMAFRVTQDKKEKLIKEIDRAQIFLNKKREKADPFINKNDVIIKALFEGLKLIK